MTEPLTDADLAALRERFMHYRTGRRLLDEHAALRVACEASKAEGSRAQRNRCVRMVSDAADLARLSNRKKAAAELDLLARDMADEREAVLSAGCPDAQIAAAGARALAAWLACDDLWGDERLSQDELFAREVERSETFEFYATGTNTIFDPERFGRPESDYDRLMRQLRGEL